MTRAILLPVGREWYALPPVAVSREIAALGGVEETPLGESRWWDGLQARLAPIGRSGAAAWAAVRIASCEAGGSWASSLPSPSNRATPSVPVRLRRKGAEVCVFSGSLPRGVPEDLYGRLGFVASHEGFKLQLA